MSNFGKSIDRKNCYGDWAKNEDAVETYKTMLDTIDIKDDFMFCSVMKNADLCKEFLERILQISINRIEYTESQKSFYHAEKSKSIRLDVYVNDDKGTVYDIEMQKNSGKSRQSLKKELPRRARYYTGMIDLEHLRKGRSYRELPKNIIIFVCDFDPFEPLNKAVYDFEYRCLDEPELELSDGTQKLFVNIKGKNENLPEDLKYLMEYMDKGTVSDRYTEELEERVHALRNNDDWRVDRMTLEEKLNETYEDGREDGLKEGFSQGKTLNYTL